METLWQDLRYGARMLARSPGFTSVAVLTLALGIGATSALFSMVSALVLHPLPFKNLDRIVTLWETLPSAGAGRYTASPANLLDWTGQEHLFEHIAAYRGWNANLTGVGEPERLRGFVVSPDFFSVLGMETLEGRSFTPQEAVPGQDRGIVLSYGFWQRSLGGAPAVVGKEVTLDDRPVTVIAVMPPAFDFPLGTDFWAPLALSPQEWSQRGSGGLRALALLRADVTLPEAQAEMDALAARLAQQYPETNRGRGVQLRPLLEETNFGTRRFILFLLGAAGFLLLLACANVANLQLARGIERQKEIAVRTALGAGRGRIVRQLLTESVLLSLVGAALGVLLAVWGVDLIKATVPAWVRRFIVAGLDNASVDAEVLVFTLAAALLGGVLAGLAPAWQTSKPNLHDSLKDAGRSPGAGLSGNRLRGLLVVSEVALALALLVGAGLMVKGFRGLLEVERGFDPANLLTLRITLPETKYPEGRQATAFFERALEALRGLPGVESAAAVSRLPSVGGWNTEELHIEGHPRLAADPPARADLKVISEAYFSTAGIPVRRGRHFEASDGPASPPVAIINETMAQRFWPAADPLGQRVKLGSRPDDGAWLSIVGVVGDVSRGWLRYQVSPTVYLPYRQAPRLSMSLALRTRAPPEAMVAALRTRILSVDSNQPIYEVRSMNRILTEFTSGVRAAAGIMGVFAGLAFLLSAAGIYAVASYAVSQRTHEIGVRMALGARQADILKLFVAQGMRLALFGVGLGLAAAWTLTRLASGFLLGVIDVDAGTFLAFGVGLLGVAILASYLPARRAARVDPMTALRYE